MARQSEKYHIDLINREPSLSLLEFSPSDIRGERLNPIDLINRRLEGERQYRGDVMSPKPSFRTNILDRLIQDLVMQVGQDINLKQQLPNLDMPNIKELNPSLSFDIPFGKNQRFNLSGGLNVPSSQPWFDSMPKNQDAPQLQGQMMDWLINLGIDF